MVYNLESVLGVGFTLGSAGCLLNLLDKQQGQQQLVFVSSMLVICVLSTVALWSVEGRHACWHHGCPPEESTGGKEVAMGAAASSPSAPAQAPRSCGDVRQHAGTDADELPPEDFPLERRSSFVVS